MFCFYFDLSFLNLYVKFIYLFYTEEVKLCLIYVFDGFYLGLREIELVGENFNLGGLIKGFSENIIVIKN